MSDLSFCMIVADFVIGFFPVVSKMLVQ